MNPLLKAAKELLHLHMCEQEGLQLPTKEMWFDAVNNLSEAIQSKGEQPEFISNPLLKALEEITESAQKLFDEKKNNPKNKGNGLNNAWNNLAFNIHDSRKAISLYSQSENEKDLIIHGVEEGAEAWKSEYDNCLNILEGLVTLKDWKDRSINMDQYEKLKPLQWERAKEFLKTYQHGYE